MATPANPVVKIARAVDRYDIAHAYAVKHLAVLKSHGVAGVSSMKPDWKYNPNVYMIAMYHPDSQQLIAGLRLEISSPGNPLPFEKALSASHTTVAAFVATYREDGGVAELAGLWVDKAFGKLNLPTLLTNIAIGLATRLQVKHVFAFANDYSRPLTERIGFIATSIAEQQVFMYPDERYPTQLMHIDSTQQVEKEALVAELF